jgi:outer membrane protein OmpA-like peptidoglycan-associated protein
MKNVNAMIFGGVLFAGLFSQGVWAEDFRKQVMIDGRLPEVAELEGILFPADVSTAHKDCRQMEAAGIKCQAIAPKASLETTMVTFDRGSANLTDGSKQFLDRVAAALKNRSEDVAKVTIEGHTDATGPATLNRNLSKKRADSVKAYFAQKHKITNVETVGRASDSLKDRNNPGAAVNRRIEFVVSLPGQDG